MTEVKTNEGIEASCCTPLEAKAEYILYSKLTMTVQLFDDRCTDQVLHPLTKDVERQIYQQSQRLQQCTRKQ